MTYEFTGRFVDLLASEVVQLISGEIINLVGLNVSNIPASAGEYFSVHRSSFLWTINSGFAELFRSPK